MEREECSVREATKRDDGTLGKGFGRGVSGDMVSRHVGGPNAYVNVAPVSNLDPSFLHEGAQLGR